jgi:hypothetical protein
MDSKLLSATRLIRVGATVATLTLPGLIFSCVGVNNPPPDAGGTTSTSGPLHLPLDQVNAAISIIHSPDDTTAAVTAHLTNNAGTAVVMQNGQAVNVNTTALDGPDGTGAYTAIIPRAESYVIKVNEPTRGVGDTTVNPPTAFTITSPTSQATASLSGFTVTWSGAASSGSARLTLDQALSPAVHQEFDIGADTGSHAFTAADLSSFAQGAPLILTVVRSRTQQAIQGFASSTVELDRQQQESLTPGP